MSSDLKTLFGLVVVIAIISAVVTFWRAADMAAPADLAARGLAAVRRQAVPFYGLFLPIVVTLIALALYRFVGTRWPDSALPTFQIVIVAIGVGFTILAAVVFKMRGFAEFTFLHIVYAAGYGWIMPALLAR